VDDARGGQALDGNVRPTLAQTRLMGGKVTGC
jgi:hypothetical protein